MPIKSKARAGSLPSCWSRARSPENFEEWNPHAGKACFLRAPPEGEVKRKSKVKSKRAVKPKTTRAKNRGHPARSASDSGGHLARTLTLALEHGFAFFHERLAALGIVLAPKQSRDNRRLNSASKSWELQHFLTDPLARLDGERRTRGDCSRVPRQAAPPIPRLGHAITSPNAAPRPHRACGR